MNGTLTSDKLSAYWMPFTANREFKKSPRIITSASGCYFKDDKGRDIYDSLSGLWTCGLGHNNKYINKAITKQLNTLDYAPSFQFSHSYAFDLAERIASLMPHRLDKVFFTNDGSESVDTALKMARAYWRKKGMASKTKYIGRIKGYHGVNFGGVSVGGIVGNRSLYGQGIDSDHLSHTLLKGNEFQKGLPLEGAYLAEELNDLIALHDASNIAAVIIEPVAGSAGVLPPPVGYLEKVREICTKNNILLIFDEVICAFGRMGSYSAAEKFDVTPDIMTTAKQLTNGIIPMGAVISQSEIYDTFMENSGDEGVIEFPHGYTYSASPVACAAAMATLDEIERQGIMERVNNLSPLFEESVHSLKGLPFVNDIRNYGLAAGITLEHKDNTPMKRPYDIAMSMWEKGFYVRFGGDTVQLGVPFITTPKEVDLLVNALGESIENS
ncbi:aspartate aminotransferase family protein [Photobacterium atrarenae]|uniref:Aspartate aminotransferase family protein n=1 Tax=Photobacterium atrarenae TaxID=865757 RepID=A0ABY5GR43_9GAMM|nr:aspartate aminotransferase family protein [Photobacterium atrarenae]UTV30733.1 aspartate aminotransferase family protein [Photobacterium atrarenae]